MSSPVLSGPPRPLHLRPVHPDPTTLVILRRVAAAALALHGLIHLIGFVSAWRLARIDGLPYSTEVLWGRLDVGDLGTQVLGVAWLLCAALILAGAAALWRGRPAARAVLSVGIALSLPLCLLASPAAGLGTLASLVAAGGLLAGAAVSRRLPLSAPGR